MSRAYPLRPFLALPAAIIGGVIALGATAQQGQAPLPGTRATTVSIQADNVLINGQLTLKGVAWRGYKLEGLLPNSRMVQGVFDDLNAETRGRWAYPDTKAWDADRNTREFVTAMAEWRRHGLLAFTLNLQGGSPEGYSQGQPWHNSAITEDGALRPAFMARVERILDEADRLGMGVILGLFYFGQDERIRDEQAVVRAVDSVVGWVLEKGYRNVLLEINNECNVRYDHAILQPARVHELIARAKAVTRGGRRLLVSTSYGGNTLPGEAVLAASDFVLLHGNGVSNPDRIAEMVRQTRQARRLHAETDRLQRGRPLRLREAVEQLRRGRERTCLVGLLRLPAPGRRVRGGLPERAGELGPLLRPQARVLRPAARDDGRALTAVRRRPAVSWAPTCGTLRCAASAWRRRSSFSPSSSSC